MSLTRVVVTHRPDADPVVRVVTDGPRGRGHLAARLLPARAGVARVALVAEGALLLDGDEVEVEVELSPGARLDLVEPAGTVAYPMTRTDGHGHASWRVGITAAAESRLTWRGQPFVVADDADVVRSTSVALEAGASVILREQLVLGRTGEAGGRLLSSTRVTAGGVPLHVEDLSLDGARPQVGVIGGARVVETVSVLGARVREVALAPPAHRLDLEGPATLLRVLGSSTHEGTLDAAWRQVCANTIVPRRDSEVVTIRAEHAPVVGQRVGAAAAS